MTSRRVDSHLWEVLISTSVQKKKNKSQVFVWLWIHIPNYQGIILIRNSDTMAVILYLF